MKFVRHDDTGDYVRHCGCLLTRHKPFAFASACPCERVVCHRNTTGRRALDVLVNALRIFEAMPYDADDEQMCWLCWLKPRWFYFRFLLLTRHPPTTQKKTSAQG